MAMRRQPLRQLIDDRPSTAVQREADLFRIVPEHQAKEFAGFLQLFTIFHF